MASIPAEERRLALLLFAQLLLNPAHVIRRIGERITITSRSHVINSAYQFDIPKDMAGHVVALPITLHSKLRLLDHFQVDIDNERVSPLSQEDTVAHILATIRALMTTEVALDAYANNITDGRTAERAVADYLCTNQGSPDGIRKALIGIPSLNSNTIELIVRMMILLRDHLPIVVLAPVSDNQAFAKHLAGNIPLRATIERRSIPQLSVSRSRMDRLRDNVRLPLGVRPTIVTADLAESSRCASYHLELFGPEGTYLARQLVVDTAQPGNAAATMGISHRFLGRFGQRYGHIYLKRRDPFDKKRLHYVAHFYERLPGSIVPAALASLGAAILIWAAASLKLSGITGGNTDVVAVILALPAIAGGWVGFEASSGLFGGALNSKLSRFATMILSLVSASIFMTTPVMQAEAAHRHWIDRPGATLWIIVSSLIALNTLMTFLSWSIRANVQAHFIGRNPTKERAALAIVQRED